MPTFTTITAPCLFRAGSLPPHRPFGGGLLAGSAHVENGDNGSIGIGCWF
ncbi:hypothetical protein AB3N55_004340 [Yersinia enterocolitica]|nr:hypothetical protein [Yersinia enterocolitica]HDL7813468.1 hypothetical protein [Yersinia enterocolitica]